MRLRSARREDLPQVVAIEKEAFPTPWSEAAFEAELKGPGRHFWVLEDKGKVIGYLCFWVWAKEMQIVNLAIKKAYQGQGRAKGLLKAALEWARRKGVKKVFLEVRERNLRAQRLYQSLGFQKVGCRKGYYADTGEDAWIMALSLTS